MENSVWRPRAKIVGIIDIIIQIISFIVLLLLILAVVKDNKAAKLHAKTFNGTDEHNVGHKSKIPAWVPDVTIVVLSLIIVMTAIHMWAAIKLLIASHARTDVKEAFRRARIWASVTFIFLAIACMETLIRFMVFGWIVGLGGLLIHIIWRVCALAVVANFIDELERIGVTKLPDQC